MELIGMATEFGEVLLRCHRRGLVFLKKKQTNQPQDLIKTQSAERDSLGKK